MLREEHFYKPEYSEIKNLRERIKQLSLEHKFYELFKDNIEISVGELFTNIIKHGQKSLNSENKIKVTIKISDYNFEISFEYFGDIPDEKRIKEVNKVKEIHEIEELSESGRGIFIIKRLMDELNFETSEGHSRATMIKYLENL